MLNVMVANYNKDDPCASDIMMKRMLRIQIENSLRCGWGVDHMRVFANFAFEHRGVKAEPIPFETPFLKATKTRLVKELLPQIGDEILWIHDLDAWQMEGFSAPEFKDIGAVPYRPGNPHFNSGSMFYRASALDIVDVVWAEVEKQDPKQCIREEFAINDVLFRKEFKSRVTALDYRYNLGSNNHGKRFKAATKPIYVRHFHPEDRKSWLVQTTSGGNFPEALKEKLASFLPEVIH